MNCSNAAAHRRADIILTVALCAAFYLLTGHDDLLETSNHAWILLDCVRQGCVGDFYNVVMAHDNPLYYVNNAHYNILCYALYALWQLPVYLVSRLGGFAVSETFLMFWSKAVGTAAYGGCAVLMGRIARKLGYDAQDRHFIPLYFTLQPIAFFASLVIGQYDSLCLVFLLAAVLAWLDRRLWRFSLLAGVALVFKFFPLLLFVPLLVVAEKRPLRCAAYAAASLWLYLPTALLYRGRTGDMGVFNDEVIRRVFTAKLAGGLDDLPLFLLLYACLLVGCYLYRPAQPAHADRLMPWLGLAVYGLLFLFVGWHPQWLILLAPFLVLTGFAQTQRAPWVYLDTLLFAGFWLCTCFNFPAQLECNLFRWGILGSVFAPLLPLNAVSFYLSLVPWLVQLSPVVFAAPLAAAILFRFPLRGVSLGDRLAGSATPLAPAPSPRLLLFGSFLVCIPGIWLCCSLLPVMAQLL